MAETKEQAWRCTVCGYIHRDPEAPDWCPICGAEAADFEAEAEAPAPAAAAPVRHWRCINCGFVHTGPEAPEICEICGAPKDRFEPMPETARKGGSAGMGLRVLIAGAGIAGLSAAEALREEAPEAEITLVSRESELPYYRLNLTRYLAGEIEKDELPVHDRDWYASRNIRFLGERELTRIDPEARTVSFRDGDDETYGTLILTVGAHPFIPPIPGAQLAGVLSLRTVEDADRLIDECRPGRNAYVVGGGILGLEAAGALARRGLDVTLLEGHGWLMPRQLPKIGGERLARRMADLGIRVETESRTARITGDERAAGLELEDGSFRDADLVVVTTGVRPNSHLARRAHLEVARGLVVDQYLRAGRPDIFAAGDVAEHRGQLYGSWSAAQFQGRIAGLNAAGLEVEFGGIPRSHMLKVLGIPMLSMGRFEPEDAGDRVIEGDRQENYFRFVFRDGLLAGTVLLGDTSLSGAVKKGMENRVDYSKLLASRPDVSRVIDEFAGSRGK